MKRISPDTKPAKRTRVLTHENTALLCEVLPILWEDSANHVPLALLFGCNKSVAGVLAALVSQRTQSPMPWLPTDTLAMKIWVDAYRTRSRDAYPFVAYCCRNNAKSALLLASKLEKPVPDFGLSRLEALDIATTHDEPLVFLHCIFQRIVAFITMHPPKWKTYPKRAIAHMQQYPSSDFATPLADNILDRCHTIVAVIKCARKLGIPQERWLKYYVSFAVEATSAEWPIFECRAIEAGLMGPSNAFTRQTLQADILRVLLTREPTDPAVDYAMFLFENKAINPRAFTMNKCWKFYLGLCNVRDLFGVRPSAKNIYTLDIYKEHCHAPEHLLVAISRYPTSDALITRFNTLPPHRRIDALPVIQSKTLFNAEQLGTLIHAIN
jgi:hypothetical protein